jgi:antigen flippase
VSIPLVFLFREDGILPSMITVAAIAILTSWWFSRKLHVERTSVTAAQAASEVLALLKLGFAFMASGFLTMGAAYGVRIVVLRNGGVQAAGLYQAAWALAGMYVTFILTAMGSDFYPRLTAVAADDAECNRLVNEQAQISLLLAGPGALATLTLAPLVIDVFYSTRFAPAVAVLRWICLGMMLRVIAWPMGFIVLAKGAQKVFFWTEVAAATVHVGLAALLVSRFGLAGSGAAFFGLYVWHGAFIYTIVRHMTGFRWSAPNKQVAAIFLPLAGVMFCARFVLSTGTATILGIAAVLFSAVYAARQLLALVPVGTLPPAIRPLLPLLQIVGGSHVGSAARSKR